MSEEEELDEPADAPRLQDVANAAGVSIATASRVLSPGGPGNIRYRVSAEASKKVREAARSLKYKPLKAGKQPKQAEVEAWRFIRLISKLDSPTVQVPPLQLICSKAREILKMVDQP